MCSSDLGALLTSFEENATNLLNSGYVKIPSLSTSVGGWNSITERNAQTIGFRNDSQSYPSTLWTGNELIIYAQDMGYNPKGTRFNPTTGLWNPLPTNGAPQFGMSPSSVGLVQGDSEVFVFGDINSPLNTNSAGGIFNLVSGVWRNIPTNEFFVSGAVDTCFWTGNEVLVFNQGIPAISPKGALYSPLTNGWRPMDTNGMPQVERDAAIGWTGSELFVYGKSATNFNSAVGGLYSPASNTWREVSTNGGPVGSSGHQWVYTGTELIGFSLSRFHAFNPQSNSWRPCSTNGMPSPTQIDNGAMTKPPKLFWTGSEVGMAIAKETSPTQRSVAVYLYHPQADSWRTIADNSISIYPGSPTFPPQWTGNSALFYLPVTNGDIYNTLVLRPFRFTPPKTLYFYQKP